MAHPSKLTPEMIELLYECTGGIIAILVSIIMEAQQIAILSEKEELSKETVILAYQQRFKNVQDFVQMNVKKRNQTSVPVKSHAFDIGEEYIDIESDDAVSKIIVEAKDNGSDAVELLQKSGILVEEIAV